ELLASLHPLPPRMGTELTPRGLDDVDHPLQFTGLTAARLLHAGLDVVPATLAGLDLEGALQDLLGLERRHHHHAVLVTHNDVTGEHDHTPAGNRAVDFAAAQVGAARARRHPCAEHREARHLDLGTVAHHPVDNQGLGPARRSIHDPIATHDGSLRL